MSLALNQKQASDLTHLCQATYTIKNIISEAVGAFTASKPFLLNLINFARMKT